MFHCSVQVRCVFYSHVDNCTKCRVNIFKRVRIYIGIVRSQRSNICPQNATQLEISAHIQPYHACIHGTENECIVNIANSKICQMSSITTLIRLPIH